MCPGKEKPYLRAHLVWGISEVLAVVSSSEGTLISEWKFWWIYCHLLSEDVMCALCPQRFNWNFQQVSFRALVPCVRGRKAGLERIKRGEIILSKDGLGCVVFHLCLSITEFINSFLGLNINWKIEWSQRIVPVPCYLVKETPRIPIAFQKETNLRTYTRPKQKTKTKKIYTRCSQNIKIQPLFPL